MMRRAIPGRQTAWGNPQRLGTPLVHQGFRIFALGLFGLGSSIASAAYAGDAQDYHSLGLPVSAIPLVIADHLEVDVSNQRRIVVQLAEADGVTQLSDIAGRSALEEAWAFLPERELWVEIGQNECVTDTKSAVETDIDYLADILASYDVVRIYHFHPHQFCLPAVLGGQTWPGNTPAAKLEVRDLGKIGISLPGPADIAHAVAVSEMALGRAVPADVSFAIVTPYGRVFYGPTQQGRDELLVQRDYPSANPGAEMVIRASAPLTSANIAKITERLDQPTINDVLEELCKQSSDDLFFMSFAPFAD